MSRGAFGRRAGTDLGASKLEMELPEVDLMGEGLEEESWTAVPVIGDYDAEVRVYADGSWFRWSPRAVGVTLGALALAVLASLSPLANAVTDAVA